MNRTENLLLVTRRLIIMAAVSLLIIGAVFAFSMLSEKRFMVSWMTFGCGLAGGFVSIQQRLNKISDSELEILSRSWFQILLVPIYAGIFALVLYIMFLSGILSGHLFPNFYLPPPPDPPDMTFIKNLLWNTLPESGEDFAKLIFWSFVAGFSERWVPQIISQMSTAESEPASGVNRYPRGDD